MQLSDEFALFVGDDASKFALWARVGLVPASQVPGGACEICLGVPSADMLDSQYGDWLGRGIAMIQEPMLLGFGLSCVAQDPDGHRVRVFHPAQG